MRECCTIVLGTHKCRHSVKHRPDSLPQINLRSRGDVRDESILRDQKPKQQEAVNMKFMTSACTREISIQKYKRWTRTDETLTTHSDRNSGIPYPLRSTHKHHPLRYRRYSSRRDCPRVNYVCISWTTCLIHRQPAQQTEQGLKKILKIWGDGSKSNDCHHLYLQIVVGYGNLNWHEAICTVIKQYQLDDFLVSTVVSAWVRNHEIAKIR